MAAPGVFAGCGGWAVGLSVFSWQFSVFRCVSVFDGDKGARKAAFCTVYRVPLSPWLRAAELRLVKWRKDTDESCPGVAVPTAARAT